MTKADQTLDPDSLVARIIDELRANPDAQALLLRALLTGEFLGMPTRLARVEAEVKALRADVDVLKQDVKVLRQDVTVLKQDVAVLKDDVTVLKQDVKVLKDDVGTLKGDSLEAKMHRRIRPLLGQRLTLRSLRIIQGPFVDTEQGFADAVYDAFAAGVIDEPQETRILATDYIVRAERRSDRALVMVAVEVSNNIGQRDIGRARAAADALDAVFDNDVIAAVVGYSVHDADRRRAGTANVQVLQMAMAEAA